MSLLSFTLAEILSLVIGCITICGTIIGAYDKRISVLRDNEILKLRLELESVYKDNRHTVEMNTDAINTLALSINKLNEAVDLMQEKMVNLTAEQSAVKESLKMAHKRITELHDYHHQ